jgi:hypothetical protein
VPPNQNQTGNKHFTSVAETKHRRNKQKSLAENKSAWQKKSPMDGGKQNFAWPKAKQCMSSNSYTCRGQSPTLTPIHLTGSQIKRPGCSGYSGLFLYWQNVFYRIHRYRMFETLEGMNIQPKMIRVVNAVYNHSTFTILI